VIARGVSCDHCGAPVTFQAPFCSYCRAVLTWGSSLDIEPGKVFTALDLTRDALPGTEGWTKVLSAVQDGKIITIDGEGSHSGTFPFVLRDACISASAVCLEPNVAFGVTGRLHKAGAATSTYVAQIHAAVRAYRVQRILWTMKENYIDVIRDWEFVPAIGGIGTLNHLEMRFADSVFQVLINGTNVASFVDAKFGFGHVGWRAVTFDPLPQKKRVLFRTLEVRGIK
jgi:hypothetical protein